jgi:hypothetical protein
MPGAAGLKSQLDHLGFSVFHVVYRNGFRQHRSREQRVRVNDKSNFRVPQP